MADSVTTDSYKHDQVESNPSHKPISKIQEAGDGKEFLIIGGKKYYKHELMSAFGGTLNPGLAPPPVNKFGNAAPIGLAGFAMITFLLGMYNAQAMGVTHPNAGVGVAAFFLGGGNTIFVWVLGNGYWKYFWCYCVNFIRSFLVIVCSNKHQIFWDY